jgi:hypothetical protein
MPTNNTSDPMNNVDPSEQTLGVDPSERTIGRAQALEADASEQEQSVQEEGGDSGEGSIAAE